MPLPIQDIIALNHRLRIAEANDLALIQQKDPVTHLLDRLQIV